MDLDDRLYGYHPSYSCVLADFVRVFAARVVHFYTRVRLFLRVPFFPGPLAGAFLRRSVPEDFVQEKGGSQQEDLRRRALLDLLPLTPTRVSSRVVCRVRDDGPTAEYGSDPRPGQVSRTRGRGSRTDQRSPTHRVPRG